MDGVITGRAVGPFDDCLDAAFVREYAAATRDPAGRVADGTVVPAVAVVVAIWEPQNEAREALVPAELQAGATSGVHGEHDIVLHRPIRPGEPLTTWVDGWGARPAGRNAAVTLRYRMRDADDTLVVEQWWTTIFLGTSCDPVGAPAPEHAFPDEARARPLGVRTVDVDADMARRYAEVSGDWSPHHFEVEAARRSGFDRPFLHGLCTMALCAQAVVELAAGGAPERLRRLSVRFATPAPIGEQLHISVHDAGPLGFAFEADSADTTVISHGRAELFA